MMLTWQSVLVAQELVRKPIEFLAASRQYSQALSSQGGGACRVSAEVGSEEDFSCLSFARKIKNGLNVKSRVWWYTGLG